MKRLPQLSPSQAVVILGVLALGGWLAYLLPPDTLTRAVIGVLTLLGVAGTAMPGPGAGGGDPPPPPPARRAGYTDNHLLWALALLAFAWAWLQRLGVLGVLALCLAGCGAGAIQVQARAATVASVALEGVHRVAMSETERRLDACADVACTQDVETSMAPIGLAYEAARVALVAWVEALQLAQVAGEDGDVLSALLTAGARWLSLWDPLAAALAGVGLEVPRLPPLVTGLLGGVPR